VIAKRKGVPVTEGPIQGVLDCDHNALPSWASSQFEKAPSVFTLRESTSDHLALSEALCI
jgi:hypothetical protein